MIVLNFVFVFLIGGILGYFLYRAWDQKTSKRNASVYQDPAWPMLADDAVPAAPADGYAARALKDFSNRFIAELRGVLASPTPVRLGRFAITLATPCVLERQLWKDMARRLSEAYMSYPAEYFALLRALGAHAKNPTQLYAAYQLARAYPNPPSDIKHLQRMLLAAPELRARLAKGDH